jgi:nucleoside-diphosphate-sugar epimerase
VTDRNQRVRDRLAGRSVLVTGASGFLGKAVLAALLRHGEGIERLVVLLRASSDEEARRRLRDEVLVAEPFAGLGDGGRIRAIAGDLSEDGLADGPEWAGIDIVVHCAATVSFEEPLDHALALNSFGPVRLLERLERAGSRPHFVHVSTAYVADRQSGEVAEDGLPHHAVTDLDPERMREEARGWREAAERESRAEPQASRFAKAARRDASMREGLDADERAEELRRRWLLERLSRRGRRRARGA